MLEAFGCSDNPPTVAIRTWYVPAAARFDGQRRFHGCKVPLGTVFSLPLRSPPLDVSVSLSVSRFPCLALPYRGRLTGALPIALYLERMNTELYEYTLSRHPTQTMECAVQPTNRPLQRTWCSQGKQSTATTHTPMYFTTLTQRPLLAAIPTACRGVPSCQLPPRPCSLHGAYRTSLSGWPA